jgi:hypothetical protein
MTSAPPEITAILLDMLSHGLLAIRGAGDAELAALHADHLHNLPSLIDYYSPDRLHYYWEAERPGFVSRCPANQLDMWQSFWERLAPHIPA